MYVCLCQGITDKDIRNAINEGCCNYKEVRETLEIAKQCGKCGCLAKQLVKEALTQAQLSQESAVQHFTPSKTSHY